MQMSKLLNGTVWASTEILKKTIGTLCLSQHFLESWAQVTITSDFFPLSLFLIDV